MIKMEHHQRRLWIRMIDLIEKYREEEVRFSRLVSKLERTMDAIAPESQELVEQWYDLWQPLEIQNAVEGDEVSRDQVSEELEKLESFVRKILSD